MKQTICKNCEMDILDERFERIVSELMAYLTVKYKISGKEWNKEIAPILRIFYSGKKK